MKITIIVEGPAACGKSRLIGKLLETISKHTANSPFQDYSVSVSERQPTSSIRDAIASLNRSGAVHGSTSATPVVPIRRCYACEIPEIDRINLPEGWEYGMLPPANLTVHVNQDGTKFVFRGPQSKNDRVDWK